MNRRGANAMFINQDVSKASDWTKVVSETEKAFDPVTVLVLSPVPNISSTEA